MNILALDTVDKVLSVALRAGTGIWHIEIDDGSRHSELLMDCIDSLFKIAGIKSEDLDSVVCMKGPGSFTGLRIGFSTAKGLSTALGIPVFSIPTLDCLAHHLSFWPGLVLPAIDAKKNCFFSALYYKGKLITVYLDVSPETLAKEISKAAFSLENKSIILTGGGAELLKPRLSEFISPDFLPVDPQSRKGRARELIEIAISDNLIKEDCIDSGPVYLRKSDAELNWR